MGSLVTTATLAYDTWKAANLPTTSEGWAALTDAEVIALYRTENQLKLAITTASDTETAFYAARSEAFAALEAEHVAERQALQATWQAKEDNGFVV